MISGSIGWLVTHMIGGEVHRMTLLGGGDAPEFIAANENFRAMTPYGKQPGTFGSAESLIALGRETFEELTLPTLQNISDPSADTGGDRLKTVGELLRHLVWHWIYHSGHVGLVRLQWGSEYDWTFAQAAED